MKKVILTFALLLLTSFLFANTIIDFERLLQMKAVETACYGTYVIPGSNPPYDYYTVSSLSRFQSSNNGQITSVKNFIGVCMDYSVWMFNSIIENKIIFERYGMKQNQLFIAVSSSNPNNGITLYKLSNRNNADVSMNGYYFKRHHILSVTPHKNNTNHAWIIIQHNNGTWFWVDPTWTDNTGRVIFGVIENNKEIYKTPIESLCIIRNDTVISAGSSFSNNADYYMLPFYVGTILNFGISDNQDIICIGIDIFGIRNKLGVSLEYLYRDKEIYTIIDSYTYEIADYIEYAFYFSINYSFINIIENRIMLGGTLGMGFFDANKTKGITYYSPSGIKNNVFEDMTNQNIDNGSTFKIGAYIMVNLGSVSFKTIIDYKSFGGYFTGFGVSFLL